MTTRWRIQVEGMTCEHCEVSVEQALRRVGVSDVEADFRRGEVVLVVDGPPAPERWQAAIREAGYQPGVVELLTPTPEPLRRISSKSGAYDLVIVGSGSAAFAAAIRARDLGARVLMIEAATLGGTCVNVGCVPSKFLLQAAEVYHRAGHHPFTGIHTRTESVDWPALVAQKDELIRTLRKEKYEDLISAYDWDFIRGWATFQDVETLTVDGRAIRAPACIIATGASPWVPPIPGLAETGYLTSTTAMALEALPRSMAVIGGNAIGLEMGQLFARLGVQVTIVEIRDRIAPFEEPEVSEAITAILQDEGVTVLAPARVERVEQTPEGKRLWVRVNGETRPFTVDVILVATGRRPNTDRLGLDRAGIAVDDRGAIVVDDTLQTTNPRVWAAGDVTPAPQFVYVAAYEGAVAAENALNGNRRRVDLSAVPRVTFTSPPIASVGLTERAAREQGHNVRTAVLPLSVLARAWVNGDTRGLFKLVADAGTDRLLGVHVVANGAGDVIYAAQLAVQYGLRVEDLVNTLAPYLTMAEGLRLAAQAFARDVRKMSCCA